MEIRQFTDTDEKAWDAYVLAHPEGTAYQLSAWKNAVASSYGFQDQYLLAEDNGGLCGVLPLIDFRIPLLGRTLTSLPYCDAGGVLADSEGIALALLDHAQKLAVSLGAGCQVRSVLPLPFAGSTQTDKVRMVLDLPENSELFLASLKSKIRTKIKKPLKCGFEVKVGSYELIADFYSVFAENMHELGSPVHSRRWIEAIVGEYKEKIRIAVVSTPEGIPAATGIILLHPRIVSNPWASSLRRYNHMKPNMLLYSTLLSFAADNGFKKFDFGRSTPGEGTYLFKEQWGAQPNQLYWYDLGAEEHPLELSKQPVGFFGGLSGKRDLAARLWRKIPEAGANWLGPRIRKYISL